MTTAAIYRACLDVFYYSGMQSLSRSRLQGLGSIFCFHHVLPGGGLQKGFAPNAKLEITPEFLEGIIHLVRARGFETVSLSEAINRTINPKPNPNPCPHR